MATHRSLSTAHGVRFVHNLYGDGRPIESNGSVQHGGVYLRLRDWIVSRGLQFEAIAVIKAIHTMIFVVIMGFIVHFTWSGIRNRVTRWALATLGLVAGEGIVLGMNGGRCPLTILVEDLGSTHG